MGVKSRSRVVRRVLLAGAAALVLTLGGTACFPAAAQELSVTGRVVDEGERPLAGAEVTLHAVPSRLERGALRLDGRVHPEPAARAVTDEGGLFRLVAPEAGFWTLVARSPGRVPMERTLHPLLAPADLEPVTLLPDAGLALRVTDEDGEPLAGIPVLFWGHGPANRSSGRRPWSWRAPRRRAARTGPEGRAVLPRFEGESGRLYLASPGRLGRVDLSRDRAPSPLRVTLPRSPARVLRVLTSDGRPAAGAVVWPRGPIPLGETADDGTLPVPLPGGEPLRVHVDAPGGRVAHADVEPPAEGEARPREAVLAPVPEVAGRVVRAGDGTGIAGALVWPEDDPAAAVRAGRGGVFHLPVLHGPEGVEIVAVAPGFLGTGATLPEGPEASDVVLALEPETHLVGRVVDGEGDPLPGASVQARVSEVPFTSRWSVAAPWRARTGSDGRFRIVGLPRGGPLSVRASLDGYAPWSGQVTPVTAVAEAGGARYPEVEAVLTAGATLRGRLVDREGAPVAGAEVALAPAGARRHPWEPEPEGTVRTESGADGGFELPELPAGRFDLGVVAVGRAPLLRPALEVPSEAGIRDLGDLVLEPEAVVEGVVEDPRGLPVAGAEVRPVPDRRAGEPRPVVGLREDEAAVTTSADGRFRLGGLPSGDAVELTVSKEGFATAVVPGVRPPTEEPLRVVLEAAARVAGRVVDEAGRGVADAHVSPSPRHGGWGRSEYRPPPVAEDGSFLAEVPPGTVHLQARARGYLPSAPVILELAPGESRDGVELVLRPAAVVRGRVLTAEGAPVARPSVSVTRREAMGSSSHSEMADAQGRFELYAAPGRVELGASKEGVGSVSRDLELGPEGATVELRLGRGTEVSGHVVGPDGEPAPGLRLSLASPDSLGPAPHEVSAGDGSFRFEAVADGTYRLQVTEGEPGHGRFDFVHTHPEPVAVEGGAPVPGIVVRLPRRSTLRGRLLGVEPAEIARVTVGARGGEPGFREQAGRALDGGRYEVDGLGPGRWTVTAAVEGSGKRGRGTVEIGPGQGEARLDLELREGLTVTGTVLWNGEPAAGVRISTFDRALGSSGEAITGPDGRFELRGLSPGRRELSLAAPERGLFTSRTVEVRGGEDLVLEIDTTRVRGTVLSAVGMEPLVEASVTLDPRRPGVGFARSGRPTETDGTGTYLLESVEPGPYHLRVSKAGYGAHASEVEVLPGETTLPPVVLEPAEALELRVRGADGTVLEQVGVRALDPGGATILETWLRATGDGRLLLESLPPGTWELVIFGAEGSAAVRTRAVSPGPPVEVVLPPAGTLEVSVPALAGSEEIAHVTVTDGAGRPAPVLESVGGRVPFAGGSLRVPRLPPGTWTLGVTAADGRTWSATVTLAPGATEAVELR